MTDFPYEPLGDRLVVDQERPETIRASGIIIPDQAQERPVLGCVIAIGDRVDKLQVGDTVLYSKYGGIEVKVDDKNFLVLRQPDVLLRKAAPA